MPMQVCPYTSDLSVQTLSVTVSGAIHLSGILSLREDTYSGVSRERPKSDILSSFLSSTRMLRQARSRWRTPMEERYSWGVSKDSAVNKKHRRLQRRIIVFRCTHHSLWYLVGKWRKVPQIRLSKWWVECILFLCSSHAHSLLSAFLAFLVSDGSQVQFFLCAFLRVQLVIARWWEHTWLAQAVVAM